MMRSWARPVRAGQRLGYFYTANGELMPPSLESRLGRRLRQATTADSDSGYESGGGGGSDLESGAKFTARLECDSELM